MYCVFYWIPCRILSAQFNYLGMQRTVNPKEYKLVNTELLSLNCLLENVFFPNEVIVFILGALDMKGIKWNLVNSLKLFLVWESPKITPPLILFSKMFILKPALDTCHTLKIQFYYLINLIRRGVNIFQILNNEVYIFMQILKFGSWICTIDRKHDCNRSLNRQWESCNTFSCN